VDHCEKVFGELLTAPALVLVCLIEKDESGACSSDDPLNQLDTEACEAVAMGHHNFFDCSCLNTFQKPRETFPLVVEARGDVLVDCVVRELGLHPVDLSPKVIFLFAGGDPTVDGPPTRFRLVLVCGGVLFQGEVCTAIGRFVGFLETGDIEAALAARGELEVDEGLIGPRTQGVATDTESVGGFSCRQELPSALNFTCIFHSF
jgi:hypothetical protein